MARISEFECAGQRFRRVRSIERAVAIGVLGIVLRGAGRATLGIPFAENDGNAEPLG